MDDEEAPLAGGRVSAGVVRIGDTVRRPVSGDRTFQHDLLLHLERKGFAGTPRILGMDEGGREVLSFLPGDVPDDLGHFSDAQISAAAALLRRFQDATADFAAVPRQSAQVVCHNDWGPPNAVFREGLPYGIIDFDTVAPGLRLWDLGYSAWTWMDIGNPEYAGHEQVRRLGVFADAYGGPLALAGEIVTYVLARQTELAASAKARRQSELSAWAQSSAEWTAANMIERQLPTAPPAWFGRFSS